MLLLLLLTIVLATQSAPKKTVGSFRGSRVQDVVFMYGTRVYGLGSKKYVGLHAGLGLRGLRKHTFAWLPIRWLRNCQVGVKLGHDGSSLLPRTSAPSGRLLPMMALTMMMVMMRVSCAVMR